MGIDQSSPDAKDLGAVVAAVAFRGSEVVGGGRESRKFVKEEDVEEEEDKKEDFVILEKEPYLVGSEEEESDDEDEEEDDDDFEEDAELEEGLMERLRILRDAAALKNLASHFLHPEHPVSSSLVSPETYGRNYYGRASAPQQSAPEDDEECVRSLVDALALKAQAVVYAHPEVSVEADRAAEAVHGARCYFDRLSAEPHEEEDVDADRDDVLADMRALREAAYGYLHPEASVQCLDPTLFGRNYFLRHSASFPEQDEGTDAERKAVLEDALALKKLAVDYAHPERHIEVDGAAYGRNYFGRASAVTWENEDENVERCDALADAMSLKKLAVDYAHPEKPVESSDSMAMGRNYFSRPSASEYEDEEADADRDDILADMLALKRLATDFAHPEMPVTVDPSVFGRNYFGRISAPEQEDFEVAEERAAALANALSLKKLAVDYAHPERSVETTDSTIYGRNYYGRPSADEYEEEDVDADRDDVLADMLVLKKLAMDYAHPESAVVVDASSFGRNYYGRPSAAEHDEVEQAEERVRSLADSVALGKFAADFAHPERSVENVDPTAFGRNYFHRYSASDAEGQDEVEDRVQSLADAAALEQAAAGYFHPERGVKTSDAAASARCYYSRYSSAGHQDQLIVSVKGDVTQSSSSSYEADDFDHISHVRGSTPKEKLYSDADIPRTQSSHMLFGMMDQVN